MTNQIRFFTRCAVFAAALSCLAATATALAAGDEPSARADKERKLISVLQSDAPPPEKAITCKRLAIYGSKDAVPALAPLLSNAELASWARIALEAIPDPAAGDALRQAMTKVQGRLLIGVINSIGVRRDADSVGALAQRLSDADAEVASAAAEALGHIGGEPATKALGQALASAPIEVRSAVALGCVECAEKLLAAGNAAEAVRLYDAVRQANVPKQRVLEAIRGAILARQSAGIPLLLEQLRSTDRALFAIGLRTARELQGRDVTQALVTEFKRSESDRQALLLLALGDRGDAAVLPTVVETATQGPKNLRIVALEILGRLGDVSCVPVLLNAAAEGDPELTKVAKPALARLEGKPVDADLLARLPQASGKTRQVLIELAGLRRIDGALPIIVQSAENPDAGVRRSAVETIGAIGEAPQAADLVRLLPKAQAPKERDDLERALIAICARNGARCLPSVLPLARNDDSALRVIAVHALASIGGAESLATVKAALNDQDETVQDEAVSSLSTWPGNWPDDAGVAEPLLALAKSGRKLSHQVKGLRGYLQHIQEGKALTNDEKVAKVKEVAPLLKRPEEKRLAIAVLSTLPTPSALELLMSFAADPAVAEEACLPIVKIAAGSSLDGGTAELRRNALQTVVEKSKNDATKRKAEGALKRIN